MGVSIAAVRALHHYGLADADIARLLKCPLGTVESCRRLLIRLQSDGHHGLDAHSHLQRPVRVRLEFAAELNGRELVEASTQPS